MVMTICEEQARYTDELIESYAMRQLSAAAEQEFEEHMLLCEACQARLTEADQFVTAMRAGLARGSAPRWTTRLGEAVKVTTSNLGLGHAAGLLATVALAIVILRPAPNAGSQEIELKAVRGIQSQTAKVGADLKLKLDIQGLAPAVQYRTEVTDAAGSRIWEGSAPATDGKVVVTPGKVHSEGTYWVRVYEPGGAGSLLREFPLQVKR